MNIDSTKHGNSTFCSWVLAGCMLTHMLISYLIKGTSVQSFELWEE